MPRRAALHATPNLAPMVDVVMVILIFFMLGTSFALSEGALPTRLPAQLGPGGAAVVTPTPTVRISLHAAADGQPARIAVMGQPLTDSAPAALLSLLREKRRQGADPRGRIVLAAEPAVRYRDVIAAFDACLRAGFTNVQFAIRTPADDGPATPLPPAAAPANRGT